MTTEGPAHALPLGDERPEGSNPTDNPRLADIIERRVSRRAVMAGGLAAAATAFFSGRLGSPGSGLFGAPAAASGGGGLLGFTPVPTGSADAFVVPPGYEIDVLIPWGTPIRSTGPAWNEDASNTAAEQAEQIGMHHDGMHFFPFPGEENTRGLLVVNHEYVDRTLLYSDGDAVMTPEKVNKALAAHGVSVVEIALVGGTWQLVDSRYNRRITGHTPMRFQGPIGTRDPRLASELGNPPLGTLNNCAHGYTPWGTYLTCEENWNGYFGTADTSWTANALEARYGVTRGGFGYRWHLADPRFDLAVNRTELNRFGWIVEIDPFKPRSTPVKRTALGRIKHEGALFAEANGHAVIYTGDDENGDYFYKFVSSRPWRDMRALGQSPLRSGTLYVAKFYDDGTGEWVPLKMGTGPFTRANGWANQGDVMLRTRQAADAVGATRLDRPEWSALHPHTQEVFLTLTNGTTGGGAVNPRNPNPYGHIIKLWYDEGDHTATTFEWEVWILAGDPAYDPSVTLGPDSIFGSPDGLWIDPDGRMWIETDISNSSQNRADRGYNNIGNNAMLAADPVTKEIRRFLVGPRGCEITGVITTPDQRTMFVNVQHPGESTTFWGNPTPANPRVVSNWPDFSPTGRPRSATVVIRKTDGGIIGT
jgi:secreted PhoX family phosphatase